MKSRYLQSLGVLFAIAIGVSCSVNKQSTRNEPPTVNVVKIKGLVETGRVEQLDQLSMFFWPLTQKGRPLSSSERVDIVAKVSVWGREMDGFTDQQNAARLQACNKRREMIEHACLQFDPLASSDQINQKLSDYDDPCGIEWISGWKNEEVLESNELKALLKTCQKIVDEGLKAEGEQQKLARAKDERAANILEAVETEESSSNFFLGMPANSMLTIGRDQDQRWQIRIKLAFSSPNMIYDSNPNEDRGLIKDIRYDQGQSQLFFTMVEKRAGKETGGLFRVSMSRMVTPNDLDRVRFMGKVHYSSADGQHDRDGRIKIDGLWGNRDTL